jgi:two-component system, chemotaxis family, sensor kinase CheA
VSERDPELDRLLAGELERRLQVLDSASASDMDVRAALHSLKGSAAMAGYSDLALVIGQLSARVRAIGEEARVEAADILAEVLSRLDEHEAPFATSWPEPPPPLAPSSLDARYYAEYQAAMRDRLGELDQVLSSSGDAVIAIEQALRSVHAMKGASGAVGDDVTAWYCHGLEARLRVAMGHAATAPDAIVELSRHRVLLALLIEDPARGLETLRAVTAAAPASNRKPPSRRVSSPPTAPPNSTRAGSTGRISDLEDPALRIGQSALDHVFDRLDGVDTLGDELASAAEAASRMSTRLAAVRLSVLDAVRRIGPARPWGPPAAALADLEAAADALRRASTRSKLGAVTFRNGAASVRSRLREMREGLTSLRRTSMGWVFERVDSAVRRFADAQGKLVRVETSGSEIPVDRVLAERLIDAVMQLARNAVAHGVQTPERRESAGKAPTGTIWLRAEREGNWLRIQVEDDGQGADVDKIREVAAARGLASAELLEQGSDPDLMGLLLLPGMSTQEGADLLAGRGIGLDLVQGAARRFGGAVRLRNRESGGLIATLELPSDQSVVDVLWIEEHGTEFALPASYAGRVELASAPPVPRLSACLGERAISTARLTVELIVYDVGAIPLGVDRVGDLEEVSVRALPPRIASAGPFAGAVLRPDGSLRLVLDGPALATRARVLSTRSRSVARNAVLAPE